jgi:IMP dehydrogenase
MYTVKHFMTHDVVTVDHTATIEAAVKIMAKDDKYEGYVIILKQGKPEGIVTERDLVNKVLAQARNPAQTTVADVMSTPLVTIDPDDDVTQATQVMKEQNVRKLIVMKNGIIYGVITAKHISQHFQDYVDRSIKEIIRWTAAFGFLS